MILVLGGNGFVGSGLARMLRAQGREFEIVTRANYDSYVGHACEILINANGNSKKFLAKDDPKSEFHASVASVRNSLADFSYGKYVLLSSCDVYPDCSSSESTHEDAAIDVAKQSPYGFHKYLAELCVRHAAARWLIVRQGGFVGPGLKKNAVFDVLRGERVWVRPESRFQYIHTDASARAVLTLLDMGICNQIVNLTARGTISVAEIMRLAGRRVAGPEHGQPVICDISTDKAAHWLDLPSTRESVEQFLASGGGSEKC
jgi:nucleoside-diphosphate-sugar epimerase